ncbi:MAG: 6-bladed beta-propeller [bacterium]
MKTNKNSTIICLIFFSTITVATSQQSELRLFKSIPENTVDQSGTYLIHPYDLSISEDLIFIADAKDCCIKVFNKEGIFIRKIGSRGKGPGELLDPFVIAIDDKNKLLYCDDKTNGRISVFQTNGNFMRAIRVFLPYYDIAILKENLFTSSFNDINSTLFCKYNSTGKLIRSFGNMIDKNHKEYYYARTLYESELYSDGKYLYTFFIKLPLINVYSSDGELITTINLIENELEKIREKNIEGAIERIETGFIPVKSWLFGAYIKNSNIYCYSRTIGNKMFVFNNDGKLIKSLLLNCGNETAISKQLFFRHIDNNGKFYFADIAHAKIRIFTEYNR